MWLTRQRWRWRWRCEWMIFFYSPFLSFHLMSVKTITGTRAAHIKADQNAWRRFRMLSMICVPFQLHNLVVLKMKWKAKPIQLNENVGDFLFSSLLSTGCWEKKQQKKKTTTKHWRIFNAKEIVVTSNILCLLQNTFHFNLHVLYGELIAELC